MQRFDDPTFGPAVNEYKLELHCAEEHVDELVNIIVASARTGRAISGWVAVY